MKTDDFVWMWQGITRRKLTAAESFLLQPIEIKKDTHKHAILLLHGFASTPAVFRALLPGLKNYDGIFVPALPGHASSIQHFSQARPQDWLDYTHTLCHQLTQQYQHVDVLGLSLGGLLAQDLSLHFTLRHLYLLAPALYLNLPITAARLMLSILNKIGRQSIRNQGGNLHSHTYEDLTYRRLPIATIQALLDFIQTHPFPLPTCPTDLFLGKHDAVVNSTKVEKLFRQSPETNIHWLKHSAHVLPLDADRNHCLRIIQKNLLS